MNVRVKPASRAHTSLVSVAFISLYQNIPNRPEKMICALWPWAMTTALPPSWTACYHAHVREGAQGARHTAVSAAGTATAS